MNITELRLANQQIVATQMKTPAELVQYMLAMQAQDYPGAKWSLALRLTGMTEELVEKAIAEREVVRTWPMRGTLHLMSPADLRWMLGLLTPRILAGARRRQEELELDEKTFAKSEKIFTKALQGGKQLERAEMMQVLEAGGITTNSQRGYHLLWQAAQHQVICFGPMQGKQPTFVLVDEWIPKSKTKTCDEALTELALRYFTSHGPATLKDFAWWAGLRITEAREAVEAVKKSLTSVVENETTYYMGEQTAKLKKVEPTAFLLPGFDEYLLGYTDRSAALDPKYAQAVCPGSNGVFLSTVVVNGKVIGTWKREVKKDTVNITPIPFTKFSKNDKELIQIAAQKYAQYLKKKSNLLFL